MKASHDQNDRNAVDAAEEATWILIARIMMNVDEFITRE